MIPPQNSHIKLNHINIIPFSTIIFNDVFVFKLKINKVTTYNGYFIILLNYSPLIEVGEFRTLRLK